MTNMNAPFQELSTEELQTSFGGSVIKVAPATYCTNVPGQNRAKCWVDWREAGPYVGKIIVNGWVQHGPWAH